VPKKAQQVTTTDPLRHRPTHSAPARNQHRRERDEETSAGEIHDPESASLWNVSMTASTAASVPGDAALPSPGWAKGESGLSWC